MRTFDDLNLRDKERYSSDYGGMLKKEPSALMLALNEKDARRAISHGLKTNLKMTFRGAGRSCAGQSLSNNGLLIESYQRDASCEIASPQSASIPAWAQLCQAEKLLNASGWSFPVLPVYLNLSLGGVLSAGGLGLHSITHGQTIDHVKGINFISPRDEVMHLSMTQQPELFRHVLAGQGHLGFIEGATLNVVPFRPYTHARNTITGICSFLKSVAWIRHWSGETQLQFIGSVGLDGHHTALYGEDLFDADETPSRPWQIAGSPQKSLIEKHHRLKYHYDIAFNTNMLRNSKGILYSAYCFEYEQFCLHAERLIDLLRSRPAATSCVSRIPFYAVREQQNAPFFPFSPRRAKSEPMLFGIGINWAVPLGDEEMWQSVQEVLADSLVHCLELGGKPYLGCWHDFTEKHLKAFYPKGYQTLLELKQAHDPQSLIHAGQLCLPKARP